MRFVLVLFMVFISTSSIASELATREQISNTVNTLFHTGEYEQLNRIGRQFLESEERTTSGLWKLSLFYTGVDKLANREIPDPDYWNDLKSQIEEWIKVDPTSSFAHMAYAQTLISQAWMYRGTSWGHTVRAEDRALFHQAIEEARLYLLEHESLKAKDPNWFLEMITVARVQSWEESRFNTLIDEAFTRHPAYYPNYFGALNYFLPKWHGSTDAIESFVEYAVEKSQASEGNGLYARIYWYASEVEYGHQLFTNSEASWKKMKLGIADVLREYPDQWNINNFAVFSCLAGDRPETRKLMNMIEGRPILRPWRTGAFYARCAEWSGVRQ